jgi:hypothetical protein
MSMPCPFCLPGRSRLVRLSAAAGLAVGLLCWDGAAQGADTGRDLFDGFGPHWRREWREQRVLGRSTVFRLVDDGGCSVLQAESRRANSGLLRELAIERPESASLRWRWKVRQPLVANMEERRRRGDDFAARVAVVFETSINPLRTRAINYVWAAHLPVGECFPSPYTDNVAMIVLQSGIDSGGVWREETRDLLADYRRSFGRDPERIRAVGLMSDTDNTGMEAEAWFADLVFASRP